jgi:hypothetical protein
MIDGARTKGLIFAGCCVALVAGGCSDDEDTTGDGGSGGGCRDYATVTPGASFKDDVMPLFARSCALASSCHQGDPGSGMEDLGLGPNMDNSPAPQATLDAIHDQLVNQDAMRSPLPYVTPDEPGDSWLMAKIEYGEADLAMCSMCEGEGCGVFMPFGSPPESGLSRAERDVIAAWILDGAQNN